MNEMPSQFDLELLEIAYGLDNFLIKYDHHIDSNLCLVCFSSNAIYYPNDDSQLNNIIKTNRFEWVNLAPSGYKKYIFLRDVYKQWYVNGINNSINSQVRLIDFLRTETDGYDITCIGASSGGYAAVLFGSLLQAKKIFSFSGQFNLTSEIEKGIKNRELVKSALNDSCFIDVCAVARNVFYFLPVCSRDDLAQSFFVKNNKNVVTIKFNSSKHGVIVYPFALEKLLTADSPTLIKMAGRLNSPLITTFRYMRISSCFLYLSRLIKRSKIF